MALQHLADVIASFSSFTLKASALTILTSIASRSDISGTNSGNDGDLIPALAVSVLQSLTRCARCLRKSLYHLGTW